MNPILEFELEVLSVFLGILISTIIVNQYEQAMLTHMERKKLERELYEE